MNKNYIDILTRKTSKNDKNTTCKQVKIKTIIVSQQYSNYTAVNILRVMK